MLASPLSARYTLSAPAAWPLYSKRVLATQPDWLEAHKLIDCNLVSEGFEQAYAEGLPGVCMQSALVRHDGGQMTTLELRNQASKPRPSLHQTMANNTIP